MKTINTVAVVENIVTLLRSYGTEMQAVPKSDRPFVLRRLQRELRHRVVSTTSADVLEQYRVLDQAVESDLLVPERSDQSPATD